MSKPATKFGSFFVTKTRENGERFVSFTEDVPKWLKDACGQAMRHALTDWLYDECEAACDAFDAGDLTDEDRVSEHADSRVEVYTQKVFQWAADHCLTDIFAEAQERASELDGAGEASVQDRLKVVQYCTIELVAQTILSAIEEHTRDADLEGDVN